MRTVVFFGDSLTRASYLRAGFVGMLAQRCAEVRIANHGVDGDTSDDLLERVHEVLEERPDRVYLMVGTNDCGWGMPVQRYRDNLLRLVASLRPADIVLVTPTTSVHLPGAAMPYVEAVREVAEREGLQVVDFASAIQESDYGLDGLHWNERGHERLAALIEEEAPLC
jgi:lysophospholipase L1-like esterase